MIFIFIAVIAAAFIIQLYFIRKNTSKPEPLVVQKLRAASLLSQYRGKRKTLIVGFACSGKDYLADSLNLRKAVIYTDRPARPGETVHRLPNTETVLFHYAFQISKDETWNYYLTYEQYLACDVIVCGFKMAAWLCEKFSDTVSEVVFLNNTPIEELRTRYKSRGSSHDFASRYASDIRDIEEVLPKISSKLIKVADNREYEFIKSFIQITHGNANGRDLDKHQ